MGRTAARHAARAQATALSRHAPAAAPRTASPCTERHTSHHVTSRAPTAEARRTEARRLISAWLGNDENRSVVLYSQTVLYSTFTSNTGDGEYSMIWWRGMRGWVLGDSGWGTKIMVLAVGYCTLYSLRFDTPNPTLKPQISSRNSHTFPDVYTVPVASRRFGQI